MDWIIISVIIIVFIIIIYLIIKHQKNKFLIFEEKIETPEGIERSWWVRDRKFNSLNEAREFAKFLKKER